MEYSYKKSKRQILMARDITKDFKELKSFIESYNLQTVIQDEDFLRVLSKQHKKYFGYLTFVAEITRLSDESDFNLSQGQLNYLSESCSDVGQSIFIMTHGSYKASRMLMRSSIENFVKGFCIDSIPEITKKKSVSDIFDEVGDLPVFQDDPQQELFDRIRSQYSDLCKDVHTASLDYMEKTTALKYFPSFNVEKAEKASSTTVNLVSSYLYLLCTKYHSLFLKMHHRNRANIISVIPRSKRPDLLGI